MLVNIFHADYLGNACPTLSYFMPLNLPDKISKYTDVDSIMAGAAIMLILMSADTHFESTTQ